MHHSTDGNRKSRANESSDALARTSYESETFLVDRDQPAVGLLNDIHVDNDKPMGISSYKRTLLKTGVINGVLIILWYTFATLLSVYNKWLFSPDHYNFQYPLFVSSIHMLVQSFFAGSSLLLLPKFRPTKRPKSSDYISKILPCAFATSSDIGLSNLSLKTITLSFYTMCKSSTLAFVLMFAFIFKIEKPSLKLASIIIIITTGVVLMVSNETVFVLTGFLQVMTACVFGGFRWSLTEVLLHKESMGLINPFVSILYLAPAQALFLVIISAIVEGFITVFKSLFIVSLAAGLHTIMIMLIGGTLAFCMIVAEFILIKRTSVVTLSVCGIFKEVWTIGISSLIFGDQLTAMNIIGLIITIIGIALYNYHKLRNASMKARKLQEHRETNNEDILETGSMNDDADDDYHHRPPAYPNHLYNMVAESTPILVVDNSLSTYRDSTDEDRLGKTEQYELR